MIREVIALIKKEIQNFLYLKDTEDIREVVVISSNILNQEGKTEFIDNNDNANNHRLIITLVNIEEEKNLKP